MTVRGALVAGLTLILLGVSGCGDRHRVGVVGSVAAPAVPAPSPSTLKPKPKPKPTTSRKPAKPRPTGLPSGLRRTTGVRGVALTFDDGPSPVWTPKVLDRLRAAHVKATFCLVGTEVRKHPELVARIVREGHQLCNHSWHHDVNLGAKSVAQIRADLLRTSREIHRAAPGAKIPYYRQPGGNWTPEIVAVARQLGMQPLHWAVDPQDWARPPASVISKRVMGQAHAGSIVLLHDGGGDRSATLAALPSVINGLRRKFGIVPLK